MEGKTQYRRFVTFVLFVILILTGYRYALLSLDSMLFGGPAAVASPEVVLSPPDTEAPTISWVTPVENGETFHVVGESVLIGAQAADNVGVERVIFSRWDAKAGVYTDIIWDVQPPYEWELDTAALNDNFNQIVVQAFDSAGNASNRESIWFFRPNFTLLDHFLPYISKNLDLPASP